MLLLKRHDCSKKLQAMVFNSYSLVFNIGAVFTKARIATASVFSNRYTLPQEKIAGHNRVILFSNRF